MADRVVASCSEGDQMLFISNREGVTLHEVALPFRPNCLAVSIKNIAVGGISMVCLVAIETGNITTTLPILTLSWSLAFDEQETRLACGEGSGLIRFSWNCTACPDVRAGKIVIFSELDGSWKQTQLWKAGGRPIACLIWIAEGTICSSDRVGKVATWDCATGLIRFDSHFCLLMPLFGRRVYESNSRGC